MKKSEKKGFTGLARSVQCYDNQGFKNFKILTLHLEDGVVNKIEYSDPYASFEVMDRLELMNHFSVIHLNNNWAPNEALNK